MADDTSRSDAAKAAAKARLLEKFERDWADAERLASEYPDLFAILPGSAPHKAPPEAAPSETIKQGAQNALTIRELIGAYKRDPDSPYKKLKYRVRENYDHILRRLDTDIGHECVANFDARRIKRAHEQWCEGGRLS